MTETPIVTPLIVDGNPYIVAVELLPNEQGRPTAHVFVKTRGTWWRRRELWHDPNHGGGSDREAAEAVVRDFRADAPHSGAQWEPAPISVAASMERHYEASDEGAGVSDDPVIGSIVCVSWGAVLTRDGWSTADVVHTLLNEETYAVAVGFVAAMDERALVLAAGKTEDTAFALLMRIPRRAIVRLGVLVR